MYAESDRSWAARHRDILIVVVAAALLFTANTYRLSLLPLDDCFYARKGVEMQERGFSFTVTWDGHANYQNPPLPFWLLGASFAVLGANDFAARLPSLLMALGVLLLTYRIGFMLLGRDAALAGTGVLLLCPLFVQNARRCMLEIPNAFWVVLALWIVLESRSRPRWGVGLAVPLAAAALTKSVLGLLPLLVVAGFAMHREGRRLTSNPWLWAGAALGAVGAAAWPLQQGLSVGWDTVRAHFLGEVAGRTSGAVTLAGLLEYPRILVQEFQPAVVPGCIGAALALRRQPRSGRADRVFLAVWALLPVIVFSVASARSSRYVFPLLVPLSLLAGDLIVGWHRRAALLVATRIVPALLVLMAAVFWIQPSLLTRDQSAAFKHAAADIQRLVPPGNRVPLWGEFNWRLANPFVYYGERGLNPQPDVSLQRLLGIAGELPVPCFVIPRDRMAAITGEGITVEVLAELGDWLLVVVAPFRAESPRISEDAKAAGVNPRGFPPSL